MTKKITLEFAPGCFDGFEGTQEELDELIAEIQRMVDTGEIFENSQPLDLEELAEEDPTMAVEVIERLAKETTRKLQ
jgi:hypothetical protein